MCARRVGLKGSTSASAAVDAPVSNPAQDTSGTAKTESETSIALNPVTGTLCAAWNDSFSGVTQNTGFSGFGRSTDNGATSVNKGAVNPTANFDDGDPSLVWRKLDGKFYYAALKGGGLGVYRSDDDCNSFTFVANIATGNDDEIMAVDEQRREPELRPALRCLDRLRQRGADLLHLLEQRRSHLVAADRFERDRRRRAGGLAGRGSER